MEVCAGLYFSLAILLGCSASEPAPEPTPTPIVEPSDEQKKRESTDRKSTWEWKYEQMCKCKFVRDPMTPEEIAAQEAEESAPANGRFIFIPND